VKIGWPKTSIGWWRLAFAVAAAGLVLLIVVQPPPWRVFAEAGDKMRVVHYATAYSSIAAAINIALLGVLALICPWWVNAPRPVPALAATFRLALPRWFWPCVGAAMLALVFFSAPRLSHSLWDDEALNMRTAVLGRYKRQNTGELYLKEVPWRDTVFYYGNGPNNHVLTSILARASNTIWRWVARPAGLQFSEPALRIPSLIAAILGLASIALLLADFGYPEAGVVSAWILALHPWYERYAAEMRCYSFLLCALPFTIFVWRRALLTGRWLFWGIFAAAEFLMLWSYPGIAIFLMLLNLGTLLLAAFPGNEAAEPRRMLLSRWFACTALAAMVAVQAMLPTVPPGRAYFATMFAGDLGSRWVLDLFCHMCSGAPWVATPGSVEPYRPGVSDVATLHPWLAVVIAAAVAALLLAGAVRFFALGRSGAIVLCCGLLAPLLHYALAKMSSMYIWQWYLIYSLPLAVAAVALGLTGASQSLRRLPGGSLAARTLFPASVAVFFLATQPIRAWQEKYPVTAFRDSVLLTRPCLDPFAPENRRILTAGTINPDLAYDPNAFQPKSLAEVALLCRQADVTGRELWFNNGHLWLLREHVPQIESFLQDPALFTGLQYVHGQSVAYGDRMICRYIPGSLNTGKMQEYLSAEAMAFVENHATEPPEKFFSADEREQPVQTPAGGWPTVR
jgi:hypothetical protein